MEFVSKLSEIGFTAPDWHIYRPKDEEVGILCVCYGMSLRVNYDQVNQSYSMFITRTHYRYSSCRNDALDGAALASFIKQCRVTVSDPEVLLHELSRMRRLITRLSIMCEVQYQISDVPIENGLLGDYVSFRANKLQIDLRGCRLSLENFMHDDVLSCTCVGLSEPFPFREKMEFRDAITLKEHCVQCVEDSHYRFVKWITNFYSKKC